MELDFTKIATDTPRDLVPEVLPAVTPKRGRPPGPNRPGTATRGPDRSPLTAKERKACHEFIATGCKAEAVRRAYGPSVSKPERYGYQLFNKPKIAFYLQQLQQKQLNKVDLRAEEVIERLRQIGLAKPTDFVTIENGTVRLKEASQIPEEALAALQWEVKEAVTKDGDRVQLGFVKQMDSLKALELLGKNLGIFTDKVEVGVRPIFTFGDDGESA
jgi:phage terminase small subunit